MLTTAKGSEEPLKHLEGLSLDGATVYLFVGLVVAGGVAMVPMLKKQIIFPFPMQLQPAELEVICGVHG